MHPCSYTLVNMGDYFTTTVAGNIYIILYPSIIIMYITIDVDPTAVTSSLYMTKINLKSNTTMDSKTETLLSMLLMHV